MKETRRTVTSSLNEVSTDQLVKREGGRCSFGRPHPFLHKASEPIFKDDENVFSISYIWFHGQIAYDLFHSVHHTVSLNTYEENMWKQNINPIFETKYSIMYEYV